MTDAEHVLADLLCCERQVWQALVDGDRTADLAALSDGFLGVYPSGFANRDDHAGQLEDGPSIATFQLSDHRLMSLGSDHAMLSYRAAFTRPGNTTTTEIMYVSSVWQRTATGGWINVFSQDTPALD